MSNREPTQELLRRSAVLAWLDISRNELAEWVRMGIVETWRRPGAKWFYYRKSSIKEKVINKHYA